jgi:phage internal scaffolding protein
MKKMEFKTRYNPYKGSVIDQSGEKSMTLQSEADSCDINKIMELFNRTGKLPSMQQRPAQYGDARVVDYATAQQIIMDAKAQFMELPAKARKAFANDPQLFLEAIGDQSPENAEKLKKLGILIEIKKSPEEVLEEIAQNTKKEAKIDKVE